MPLRPGRLLGRCAGALGAGGSFPEGGTGIPFGDSKLGLELRFLSVSVAVGLGLGLRRAVNKSIRPEVENPVS